MGKYIYRNGTETDIRQVKCTFLKKMYLPFYLNLIQNIIFPLHFLSSHLLIFLSFLFANLYPCGVVTERLYMDHFHKIIHNK